MVSSCTTDKNERNIIRERIHETSQGPLQGSLRSSLHADSGYHSTVVTGESIKRRAYYIRQYSSS